MNQLIGRKQPVLRREHLSAGRWFEARFNLFYFIYFLVNDIYRIFTYILKIW